MEQLVAGFSGASTAQKAVKEAVMLAWKLGARLHLVTAISDESILTVEVGSDRFVIDGVAAAEHTVRQFMGQLRVEVEYTVGIVEAEPADALIDEAVRVDADLIVVGSVGMQGMGRLFGSVGNDVAHHAPCSVLIVKTQ